MDNKDLYKTILETDDFSTNIDLSESIEYLPNKGEACESDGKTVLDDSSFEENYVSYAGKSSFTFEVEGMEDETDETPLSSYLQPKMTLKDNRYKIIKVVGAGGFGVVYCAFDTKLNIEVAIKELYPSSLVNRVPGEKKMIIYGKDNAKQYAYLLDRFILEARSMAKFNSVKNIVNIFDCFQENNTAYIVMEFIKGKNLEQFVVSHGGNVDIETANKIICEILDGLSAIHSKGIIHRDIKPRNIFITNENEVKIIDFGAARFSSTEETVVTRYSKVLTPGFAPPEQYRKDTKQGPYTDIYAAGAVYYYMLTGIVPEISVDRVVNDDIRPLSEVFPNIPDYTARAIARALELNSDLRIQSASELKSGIIGKKNFRTVAQEKKLRFKRRIAIISSTALFLCVAALGVVYYKINYAGVLSIDKLLSDNVDISICIPLSTNESVANGQLTAWENVAKDFETYISDNSEREVKLELRYLSSATYEDSYAKKEKSTVFMSSDENNSPKLSQINRLISEETTILYSQYKAGKLSDNSYIAAFDPTVLYVNKKLLNAMDYDANTQDFNSIKNILKLSVEDENTLLVINETDKEYYSSISNIEASDGSFSALEEFCTGNVVFYIGHVSDNITIGSILSGYYDIFNAPDVDGVLAVPYEWQISTDCGENEINAAQLLFSYISGEDVQDSLFVQSGYMMPVNPAAFEKYIKYNPEFDFIEENIDKLYFV